MAPRGTYTAAIRRDRRRAVDDRAASVVADGFRISPERPDAGTRPDDHPLRHQPRAPHGTCPRVKVSQSGTSAFSVTMTKMSSTTYKVTIKLKSTGTAGTVRFSLSGTDGGGKVNRASRTFVLH